MKWDIDIVFDFTDTYLFVNHYNAVVVIHFVEDVLIWIQKFLLTYNWHCSLFKIESKLVFVNCRMMFYFLCSLNSFIDKSMLKECRETDSVLCIRWEVTHCTHMWPYLFTYIYYITNSVTLHKRCWSSFLSWLMYLPRKDARPTIFIAK